MIKYFCDKCGKQLNTYDIFTAQIIPPEISTWNDDAGSYILCKTCFREFQKWLNESPSVRRK